MTVRPQPGFLPDFCRLPALFAVIVAAEIVVLVLALAPSVDGGWSGSQFLAASLFAQWLALTSAVLLCQLRPWLELLGRVPAFAAAWLIPIGVAMLGAVLVHEIDLGLGYGLTVPAASRGSFALGCGAVAGVIGAAALRYFYVISQWQRETEAQAQAEVRALQARIRPHFLFNSMNSIASLVRTRPGEAERAIEDLSDLFRAALGAGQGEGSLGEEIELAERFLAIEKLRLGERLRVLWTLDEPLPRDLPMPRLVLQPLVENAVVHGISRLQDGGEIVIGISVRGRRLEIQIGNPTPRRVAAEPGNAHARDSIALRLRHHFGPGARMTTRQVEGYYHCDLSLPLSHPAARTP